MDLFYSGYRFCINTKLLFLFF